MKAKYKYIFKNKNTNVIAEFDNIEDFLDFLNVVTEKKQEVKK